MKVTIPGWIAEAIERDAMRIAVDHPFARALHAEVEDIRNEYCPDCKMNVLVHERYGHCPVFIVGRS